MASSVNERVQRRRDAMRAAGLRPVQIWVPDTRLPGFAEECRRQSLAAAEADAADPELSTSSTRRSTTCSTRSTNETWRSGDCCRLRRLRQASTSRHHSIGSVPPHRVRCCAIRLRKAGRHASVSADDRTDIGQWSSQDIAGHGRQDHDRETGKGRSRLRSIERGRHALGDASACRFLSIA